MTSRVLPWGFLSIALFALIGASWQLYDAYAWVAHSAQVRGILIQGILSAPRASEPSQCAELHHVVDGFENLTADRPAQQSRAREMRELIEGACHGDAAAVTALGAVLSNADSAEEFLQETRDRRLRASAIVSAILFTIAIVGAMGIAGASTSARRAVARDLAASEERFRLLAESATDLIRIHEADGRPVYVTPSSEVLLGFTPSEVLALPPFGLVHPDETAAVKAVISEAKPNSVRTVVHRLRLKDGSYRWFETRVHPLFEEGRLVRYYTTSHDIHARLEAERKLETLAITDELTKLHNRRGFMLLAEHERQVALRERRGLLIVYADLDGLKAINDALGHDEGDHAIIDFASLLRQVFRASDIVARVGGDEYVALTFESSPDGADAIEGRIREAITTHNEAAGRRYKLAASIGFARLDTGSERTLEELMTEADKMMYVKKRALKRPD